MKEICKKEECTACNACVVACPKQCIKMEEGKNKALYPVINQDICVDCGYCVKTCPNNKKIELHNTKKIYSAWSNDTEIRMNSASGGVCAELYKYYLSLGVDGYAVGVVFNENFEVVYKQIKTLEDLRQSQNSKYVYSNTKNIFKEIKEALVNNKQVLFIGLPCQVAGLLSYLKQGYDNLTTVDLVCHGVSPLDYLRQHVSKIERDYGRTANSISFRDPRYYTYTFTFTLSDKDDDFYKCRVEENDVYQLGYHHALIYRENCYICKYAQRQRVGDITLCDFTGVGMKAPYKYDRNNINCLLVNTEKGQALIDKLQSKISLDERPFDEAYDYEQQLNTPYKPHINRSLFNNKFAETQDFEFAATCALKKELDFYNYKKTLRYKISKQFVPLKRFIYKIVCKFN